jgi:phospholipase C
MRAGVAIVGACKGATNMNWLLRVYNCFARHLGNGNEWSTKVNQTNAANDPIKHVIVLMLENRSFDQMLGCFQEIYSGLEGIDIGQPPRTNVANGATYAQLPGANYVAPADPNHDYAHVVFQIANHNSGFVQDFATCFPNAGSVECGEVMKYHARGALPALHTLAANFTICDHWFSSLPGPTWPNRLFVHSGTSIGRVSMPEGVMNLNWHWYNQTTLYDRFNEKNVSWRIYFGDIAQSWVLVDQWAPRNMIRYHHVQRFYEDAAGAEGDFPSYVFIEPTYNSPGANDDHPCHNVLEGERLIAEVYNALRANEPLWKSTLLVVVYDEHGGYYDHVSPPGTVPPDHHQEEFTFDRLGVRVPAILVSPFAAKRFVSTQFDHTSLLRYLVEKWDLRPLGARVAATTTNSIGLALAGTARMDTPTEVPMPAPVLNLAVQPALTQLSSHQSALLALSHAMESMTDADANTIAARSNHVLTGPQSMIDVAVDRVEDFLRQQRARFDQERARQTPGVST